MASICYQVDGVGLHVAGHFVPVERMAYIAYFLQKCQYCETAIGYRGTREEGERVVVDEHSFPEGSIVFFYDKRTKLANVSADEARRFIEACEFIRKLNHRVVFGE